MRCKFCVIRSHLWKSVFFGFMIGAIFSMAPAYGEGQIDLREGWEYRWGDSPIDGSGVPTWTYRDRESPEWKKVGSPQNPPGRKGQSSLWMRIRLPEGKWQDASIYVNRVNLNFELYLESELIYKFGELNLTSRYTFAGWPFYIIPLKDGFGGKTLYFRIYSDYINIGILGRATLGSRADHITRIIKGGIDSLILGSLLIFVSSFPVFILLIKPRHKAYSFGFLSLFSVPFGFFSLCSGIYMIARSQMKELFLSAPLGWAYVELVSLYLIPVGISLFFDRTIGAGYKSIVRRIWQAHLVYTAGALAMVGLKVVSLPSTSLPVFYAIILDALILVGTSVVAAFKGNVEAKIFMAGFVIAALFAVYDALIALGLIPWWRLIADWGLFFFVLSLGLILGLRVIGLYKDVEMMAENARDIIYRYRFTPTRDFQYVSPAATAIIGYAPEEHYADPSLILKICHPDDRPQLERYLRGEGEFGKPIALRWTRKDGTLVWTEHQNVPIYDEAGNMVAIEGIARDITERRMAQEQIQKHLERLAALRTIDMAITASLDLRVTLSVLLEQVTAQLRVDAADVLLLNPYAQTLQYAAGRGFRSDALQHTRLHLGQGHAGKAALERRTVAISDLRLQAEGLEPGRSEAQNLKPETLDLKSAIQGEGFVAYYAAPLIAKGQVKGVLEIFHRAPLNPDREWLDFLEALSGQTAIAIDNAELFDGLQRSNAELIMAYDTTLEGWSKALDLRDKETEGHTQRVTDLTLRLARAMGLADRELVHIRRGALLHDIGKMGIPDNILHKPGPLTDEERGIMCRHPEYAYEMLSPISYLRPALDIPYCHHEKWDGTGYPRGLKGETIPLAARLFAVVDVWDALRSDRPYRAGWPAERVCEHIESLSGTHFDAQVIKVFLKLVTSADASGDKKC